MREQSAATGVIVFGHFEVDLRTEELRKKGFPVRLSAQSFQVLRLLLTRPGELVTRQELQKALWPDDSFGDFEHGLNAAVNRLRDALGDSAENPHFIETLPRRGYRFVGSLRSEEKVAVSLEGQPGEVARSELRSQGSQAAPLASDPLATRALVERRPLRIRWLIGSVVVVVSAVVVGAILFSHRAGSAFHDRQQDSTSSLHAVPLTALIGNELNPSLSPDGSQVVFSWDQGRPDKVADLFVKVIGSEQVQQLTHSPAEFLTPAWSPDGRTVAFLRLGRIQDRDAGIFTISPLGGPERKIAEIKSDVQEYVQISWFADSQWLVFADTRGVESVNVTTGEMRFIYQAPDCPSMLPSVAPDGQRIALACYNNGLITIRLITSSGKVERDLISLHDYAPIVAWTEDGSAVVFTYQDKIVSIPKTGGVLRTFDFTHDAVGPTVSREKDRLVYAQTTENANLWKLRLSRPQEGAASLLEGSSTYEREPDISSNGKRLVFASARSGFEQVWVSDLDGGNAVQLTHAHSLTGSPRWSPDGKWIAFDSRDTGKPRVYLVDPEVGMPRMLSTGDLDASMPTWSRDGRWIYFTGQMGIAIGVYKVSSSGGTPILVSKTPGYTARESQDRTTLYFAVNAPSGIEVHLLTQATGKEQVVAGMPKLRTAIDWTLGAKGIYFISDQSPAFLDYFVLNSGHVEKRFHLPQSAAIWGGLSLSPDETWVAYSQIDHAGSDLMLVEGFR